MLPIIVKLKIDQPGDVSQRQFRESTRAGHRAQGTAWHQQMLPSHFTPQAKGIYQNQPRKPNTIIRKLAAGRAGDCLDGGLVDNVWSGLLERTMLEPARINAYPSRVRINMIGPRYIAMRPFKSGQPDKAAEVTAVTGPQIVELETILDRETFAYLGRQPAEPQEFTAS